MTRAEVKEKIRSWTDREHAVRIFCVFLLAVLVHLFALTHNMVNHDSISSFSSDASILITQGKWFVTPLLSLDGPVSLPYLSMAVGLLAIAVSNHLICVCFDVDRRWKEILTGFCLVSFPFVGTTALYQGTGYFGIAFLGAAVSACLLIRLKSIPGSVIGIAILVLSLGAYQAYLGLTLVLLMTDCVRRLLKGENWKKVLLRGLKYILEAAVAVGLYYLILQWVLQKTNMSLSSYKGMNQVSDLLNPTVLFGSILDAYKDFFGFFFRDSLGVYRDVGAIRKFLTINNCLLAAGNLILLVNRMVRKKIRWPGIVMAAVLLGLMPGAANAVNILSGNQTFYYISIAPFVLLFVLPLILFGNTGEDAPESAQKYQMEKIGCLALSLFVLVCGCSWTIQSNAVYQKLYLWNRECDAKLTVLAAQIQNTEGYAIDSGIVFIGGPPYDFLEPSGALDFAEKNMKTDGFGLSDSDQEFYSINHLCAYMRNELSFDIRLAPFQEEYRDIAKGMTVYPSYGSIVPTEGGNRILVKLSE